MAKDSSKDSATQLSKKLDRKAKHAKESENSQSADAPNDLPKVEKEGGEDKHESTEKKKKKRKSSDRAIGEDGDGKEEKKKEKKNKRRHAEDEAEEKPKKKKKRVSFGPGTKENDGSDDEDGHDKDNVEDTMMSTATNGAEADADAEDNNDAAIEEMKKRKREKKKEKKKKNGGSSSTTTTSHLHETPILSYLSRYHTDRASWKFQKNRETHLFKHLYSLEQVPVQYNAALLAYLQGLKGLSAKARLSYGAEEVIVADLDAEKKKEGDGQGEGEGSEGSEYQQAVEAFRTRLSESKDDVNAEDVGEKLGADAQARLKKRQRAELVFFAVAGKLFSGEQSTPVSDKQTKAPGASKKKRKNRTAIVEISSSSESEDSDSDSTSSSGSSSS
ncbi:hypothetical protein N7474_009628 [Penicillium riverlandense]|uniref:uncharacterized protein n=1 Tax=Penicillium riverlandense TaxID=1903569 RepID=UPI0025479143|nr:uncharacterized protein N7474_009628 [Penicillium riverlandense]KAJ5808359.1 hypothetical protein N7474_009628 [Penicillium riverlandense]